MYAMDPKVDLMGQATLCFVPIRQSITELIIPWFEARVYVQSKGKQAISRLKLSLLVLPRQPLPIQLDHWIVRLFR